MHTIHYQKVVKVIFEETADKSELTAMNDDPLEWSWRGTDFCCPPPNRGTGPTGSSNLEDNSSAGVQMKVSSIRIFFSKQEWSELRNALICGSHYFSETVKDAVVMTKLGLPTSQNDKEQSALLSFLPLIN